MSRSSLTGSRIRERRMTLGLRQAELARAVEISPSYLNLIEHNRRRIAGKLLIEIAGQLQVEVSALTEGAEAQLLAALGDAAAEAESVAAETSRTEDFAGRFPGWAALVGAQHARIQQLERTVASLSDRMTHDPFLSASLHEMLSTVTAIRSTSSILAGDEEIEPEWQGRFHKNLFAEARRLAEASSALVNYFDAQGEDAETLNSPHEELEAYLGARGFHLPDLEAGADPQTLAEAAGQELTSHSARQVALDYFERYQADARALPMETFVPALGETGIAPLALAQRFGVGVPAVLRRLACLPPEVSDHLPQIGAVCCDGSGTLVFRRPVDGFPFPRFGAACPLWPLFSALSQPGVPLRKLVQMSGARECFTAYAQAEALPPAGFDAPPIHSAVMLLVAEPAHGAQPDAFAAGQVGVSCRICPRSDCAARREPSILADGF